MGHALACPARFSKAQPYAFCACLRKNVGTSRSSFDTSGDTSLTFCATWCTTFGCGGTSG
jgi:hypothetical protein